MERNGDRKCEREREREQNHAMSSLCDVLIRSIRNLFPRCSPNGCYQSQSKCENYKSTPKNNHLTEYKKEFDTDGIIWREAVKQRKRERES